MAKIDELNAAYRELHEAVKSLLKLRRVAYESIAELERYSDRIDELVANGATLPRVAFSVTDERMLRASAKAIDAVRGGGR